ncbi:Rsd/AlgQ family anti-sigma factor [Isoalcanivorax indicus]|uniref:Rsd/AlgQ family anti-sigma factor n=1 Tax=Isoalcanivorax indicus TaxID=2202653 RepID=UPI000DBA5B9D|nr:Rsd/AlgQ family anti-sigma factor [Isoalcanivorax indicus]
MTAEVQSTPHRLALDQWQRIEKQVQAWLRERQELLTLLCSLQGLCGLHADSLPLQQRVQRFCEVLVDYISAGHFEIYRELAAEARQLRGTDPGLVQHVLHRLARSTDAALAFNEEYDTPDHIQRLQDALPDRLTELLEHLEERFALEDQLILSIHMGALTRH